MAAEKLNDNGKCLYANVSAPASPTRLNLDNMCFYSLPTSPDATKSFQKTSSDPETEPTPPPPSTTFIEFEFETSRRFNVDAADGIGCRNCGSPCNQQQKHLHNSKGSLPAMAFADELFSDGKVMPLKLPPRLQYNNESSSGLSSPSPRSPTGVLRLPFTRRSLWNDDFDPFMVALENVKGGHREKIHRRARSMSPLRSKSKMDKTVGFIEEQKEEIRETNGLTEAEAEAKADGSSASAYSIWAPDNNGQKGSQETEQQVQKTQKNRIPMAEPKGVLFARRAASLVKMDHGKPSIPKMGEASFSFTRESKRQKIKKFLLRSATMGRASNEDKPKDVNEALPKRSFTRKFSFKSTGPAPQYNEKRVSEVTNITVMHYRPKLFLCMGYGGRYAE